MGFFDTLRRAAEGISQDERNDPDHVKTNMYESLR